MAVTQLKDGRWICYYRIKEGENKGKQASEYFGRGPDAEARARKRNDEMDLLERGPPNRTIGPLFSELATAYAESKDFNKNSYNLFQIRMEKTILPFFKNKAAIKLTHQDIQNYVEARRKTVKNSTIRREINDIKAIMNWAANRHPSMIGYNPIHNFKAPAEDNEVILPPTQEETNRIMENAVSHLLRAILLSYYLGLRPGAVELLTLDWSYINWENMTILVKSAHKGGPEKRIVPIHPSLTPILRKWHKEDNGSGPLIHYHRHPIKSIKKSWKNALIRAKIERRLRPYDLRHGMITKALEEGADIKALSEVVGSSPETLRKHYQHVSSELRRETIAKIPEIKIPQIKKGRKKQPKP